MNRKRGEESKIGQNYLIELLELFVWYLEILMNEIYKENVSNQKWSN